MLYTGESLLERASGNITWRARTRTGTSYERSAPVVKEWLYLDHGHAEMVWSTHCNNEFVGWSLRECGVTLALVGPEAKGLVDEVGRTYCGPR